MRRPLSYPAGLAPTDWSPWKRSEHRFVLSRVELGAAGPLVVIGMNPSHADDAQADRTVNRVIRASVEGGYAGWMLLNLYPQRATRPRDLPPYDSALSGENCQVIVAELTRLHVTEVLGAWGSHPHATLRRAKQDVMAALGAACIRVFTLDDPTAGGEPRHPWPRTGPLPMLGPKRYLV